MYEALLRAFLVRHDQFGRTGAKYAVADHSGPARRNPPADRVCDRDRIGREVSMAIAGAVEAWDRRWGTAEGRADWLEPEPEVRDVVPVLQARGAKALLDLGCGVGRHALFLAEAGFTVDAIDGSPVGIAEAGRSAAARGLRLNLQEAPADALPFADRAFDFVLSWNVIYHGNQGDVGRRLAEIWRVLRPG